MIKLRQKKQELKNKISKKALKKPPNQLKVESIKNHISGNLQAAEKGYEVFLKSGIGKIHLDLKDYSKN